MLRCVSTSIQIVVPLEDGDNAGYLRERIDALVAEIRRDTQARRKNRHTVRGWSQKALDGVLEQLVAEGRSNYLSLLGEIIRRGGQIERADLLQFLNRGEASGLQGLTRPVLRAEQMMVSLGDLSEAHDPLLAPVYPSYGGRAVSYAVPTDLFELIMDSPFMAGRFETGD